MIRKVICIHRRVERLVIDYRSRDWCKLPYPGHPQGCPKFNIKSTCPPQVCLIEDFIDVNRLMWLAAVGFNLKDHMDWMRVRHPKMTDRQARCVLYWQSSVNRQLEDHAKYLTRTEHPRTIYTTCPEAMGVQVIKTAQMAGIRIKPQPDDIVFKIALIGYPK